MMRLTKDEKKALPFILPGVLTTLLLIAYPLCYIVIMSFKQSGYGQTGFAGLSNFKSIINNPQFFNSVKNTGKFTIGSVVIAFSLGLIFAMIINSKYIKYKGFWRGIIFISWVIPGVVRATTFKWMYQTDGGIINHILLSLKLISSPIPWLTNSKIAIWSLVIVQIWATSAYVMLMITASLQQIPKDLYESSELDGANGLQKFVHITIPYLKEICFLIILMLIIWAVNEFSLIWVTTSGGQNTTTLSILIYNQFKVLNMNGASASAVMQLLITCVFAGVYIKLQSKKE